MTTTRFAPSPTGRLHLGHAYAAWFAREHGDRMLLRIEDIDSARSRQAYTEGILEDLRWLGIRWDGDVTIQSASIASHASAIQSLCDEGLCYPCFCSRKEIQAEAQLSAGAPQGPDGPLYPGTCRRLPSAERDLRLARGDPWALRLDAERASRKVGRLSWNEAGVCKPVDPLAFGDFVLRRKDLPTSYHVGVVWDDAADGVTLVTRGLDLEPATNAQRVLQALLGLPEPRYHHHGLVVDEGGRRLAKRDDARSVASYREAGMSAQDVLRLAIASVTPTP